MKGSVQHQSKVWIHFPIKGNGKVGPNSLLALYSIWTYMMLSDQLLKPSEKKKKEKKKWGGGVYKDNKTVTLFLFLILFYFAFFVFFFLKKKTDCTELNLYAYSEFINSTPL